MSHAININVIKILNNIYTLDEENIVKNELNQTIAKSLTRDVWKSYTVTPFEYTFITPPDYPDPYTKGVYEWSVKSSNESYGIEIIIKFLEISGDFLQIKSGNISSCVCISYTLLYSSY